MFRKVLWYARFAKSAIPAARGYFAQFGLKETVRQAAMISLAWVRNPGNTFEPSRTWGDNSPVFLGCEVLVVTGAATSPSHAYRVGNFVSAAGQLGMKSTWVTIDEIVALKTLPRSVKIVIFWRTNLDLEIFDWYRNREASEGPTVIYDTDDLTFDPGVYTEENVAGLAEVSNLEKKFLTTTLVMQQNKQIRQSDFCISATATLGSAFGRAGKESIYVPIVLPDWMEQQAEALYKTKLPRKSNGLRIVYASGTKSHGKDFLAAWPAIIEFLEENTEASLTVIGELPILEATVPQIIKSQILQLPLVGHHDLLSNLLEFDLQIAPLELPNEFVEAKSATKFMQGASIGLPTIASPSEPFRLAISHDEDGWLASSKEDWLRALYLAKNDTKRELVSIAARNSFLASHTLKSILEPMKTVFNRALTLPSRIEKETSRRKIAWILPDIPAGSGGHRNILRFVNFLDKTKFDCQIFVMNGKKESKATSDFINEHYGFSDIQVIENHGELKKYEIVFATHHSTVDVAKRFAGRNAKLAYLVQDFESYFYPMSPQYIHALNSYSDPELQIICSGPWMASKILETTGRKVPYFEFPIDSSIYFDLGESEQNIKRDGVIFFAKSDTPRRLFDTGIDALRILRKWHPSEQITLFGGAASSMRNYDSEFDVLGRLPQLTDLAKLYRTSKVGLAFSTTNPSLIPYEMMACGLPVVDVELQSDKFPKYGEEISATLARPDSLSVAEAISSLLLDEKVRQQKTSGGISLTKKMPNELGITSIMEKFIDKL